MKTIGQSMTEYLLIVTAVAVLVFAGYQVFATHTGAIVGQVDQALAEVK